VISYRWRGDFASAEVEAMHADSFGRCRFRPTNAGLIRLNNRHAT
jgi:hypothetical protein